MRTRKPPRKTAEVTNVEFTNAAVELLESVSEVNRRALTFVDSIGVIEHRTFADIARGAAQWSKELREDGVEPGDRVVVLAARDPEWRSALLGVLQAGGVAVACRAETPTAELRAIAAHAGAALCVSAQGRPDLFELSKAPVSSANRLDPFRARNAAARLPHDALPDDIALVLYSENAAGPHGARYTHASLLAQAEAGRQWLGAREGERVWCTAPDGSLASIWLLLAAWHEGAGIVVVDQALDAAAHLELLDRFQPAVVWFSDDEYAALASVAASARLELRSIRRALSSDERAEGAVAFREAFGAKVAPAYELDEAIASTSTEPVAEGEPAAVDMLAPQVLPVDEGVAAAAAVSDAAETPSRQEGREAKRARRREEQEAKERRKAEERRLREEAKSRELAEQAAAKERLLAEEAERAEREAARAEERHRVEEAERAEREAARAEERRRAEEERLRVEEELRRAKNEKRHQEEQRREAKEARREEEQAHESRKAEERRLREEAKSRELAERAAAKEREAAVAEERRRAEEERLRAEEERRRSDDGQRDEEGRRAKDEKRREEERRREAKEARRREEQQARESRKAEERRLREEAKSRELAERAAAKEREAAVAEERRRPDERQREEERRRAAVEKADREHLAAQVKARHAEVKRRRDEEHRRDEERRREAAEQAARDQLSPDTLSRISQYTMTELAVDPDTRRDAEESTEPAAAKRDVERDTE